jgi:hypothetical protein
MPHRGRLNVLCNVLQKDFASICTDFVTSAPNTRLGQGDVKYHLGSHANLKFEVEPGNTRRLSEFFAGGSLNEPRSPMMEMRSTREEEMGQGAGMKEDRQQDKVGAASFLLIALIVHVAQQFWLHHRTFLRGANRLLPRVRTQK